MKVIGHIYTEFPEKFGIPRQSGLVENARGKIVFENPYRVAEAVRGLEHYSHIWILWKFSESERSEWSPTVRPPRLGGKKRIGVFATRSPFRPNPIGLSSVRLEKIVMDEKLGPVIYVSGIDMLDGTPVYDIKPYLSYCDSHPDADCGFADEVKEHVLSVSYDTGIADILERADLQAVCEILAQDPRTAYVNDEEREWGLAYADYNIKFKVKGTSLQIVEVTKRQERTSKNSER